MKGVIYLDSGLPELQEILNVENPYVLKVANNPLIEYFFEFFSALGIRDVLILSSRKEFSLRRDYFSGSRWGLEFTHRESRQDLSVEDIRRFNNGWIDSSNIFVLESFGLPLINYGQDASKQLEKKDYVIDRLRNRSPFDFLEVTDVLGYYQLNMEVMSEFKPFFIQAGYGEDESKVRLGVSSQLSEQSTINGELNVSNFSTVENDVHLHGKNIIGERVFISSEATLEDSVVMDNTRVGKGIFLKQKIAYHNKIIDPFKEVTVDCDSHVLSKVEGIRVSVAEKMTERAIALFLLTMSFLPYCLFWVFASDKSFLDSKIGRVLALDKVGAFFMCLRGEIPLVGKSSEECVFSLASVEGDLSEGKITEIHDLFYEDQKCLGLDLRILFKHFSKQL